MKCKTCGENVQDKAHKCNANFVEGNECDYCGAVIKSAKHDCDDEATYVCNTCGRTAIKPDYLCDPNQLS
jgi:DNA-directed RNA polymerase subunit RPC12/RpoP